MLQCVHLYFIGSHGVSLIIHVISWNQYVNIVTSPCIVFFSHRAYELFTCLIGTQQQHKVLRFILRNHLFILCLKSEGTVSSPEELTVFHFSGQKQGSWTLDAPTWGLLPTATHHADSHPADRERCQERKRSRSKEKIPSLFFAAVALRES